MDANVVEILPKIENIFGYDVVQIIRSISNAALMAFKILRTGSNPQPIWLIANKEAKKIKYRDHFKILNRGSFAIKIKAIIVEIMNKRLIDDFVINMEDKIKHRKINFDITEEL